jgi:hypothetical protein
MLRSLRALRSLLSALLFLPFVHQPAGAQVTFYQDLASFQHQIGVFLVSTFEAKAFGGTPAFDEGGIGFAAHPPLNNLFIIDGSVSLANTNPTPTSKGLTGNGQDDIDLTLPANTLAVGFDTITNQFAPPVVTVYAPNGTVLATHTLTQAPNTYGFLGISSGASIGKVRWQGFQGHIQNTVIDNVRIAVALPALPSTWGRLKRLYQ